MMFSLFGPVLPYDLVRTTRRGRYVLFRCCYLAILLLTIYLLYETFNQRAAYFQARGGISPHELAEFGETFFVTFMVVQLLTVYLITPIYTASAIAEEKERRTLEFLLATDLSSREIVLSKLLSRVAQMAMLLLTGLPVLSLLQFLGGVDPDLLLFGFVCTGLTMVSLASFGLLLSLHSRNALEAAFGTYFFVALQLLATAGCFSSSLPALNFGNPFVVLANLRRTAFIGSRDQSEVLIEALIGYAGFHLSVTVLCCLWLIGKLRPVALLLPAATRAAGKTLPRELPGQHSPRPPIGDNALLWKELNDEPQTHSRHSGELRRFGTALLWIGLFCLLMLLLLISKNDRDMPRAHDAILQAIASALCVLALLMLLTVAMSAAGRFSREMERQTLDTLLTIPDRQGILYCKWLASVAYPRRFGPPLAVCLLISVWFGNQDMLALLLIIAAWFTYAAFLASVGVWFSLRLRSTVRATLMTLLTAALLVGGATLLLGLARSTAAPGIDRHVIRTFEKYAIAPPVTLCVLVFSTGERETLSSEVAAFAFSGILLYCLFAAFLWEKARGQFRRLTGDGIKERPVPAEPNPVKRP